MESMGPGEGRRRRFERVFCPAAFAVPMTKDAVDDAGVGNKGDAAHAGAAGAGQGIRFEDFSQQTSPGAAGFPGKLGIIPVPGSGIGFDMLTRRDFSHRKAWLVDRLRDLASIFAIEVCAYAVMITHYHSVLRTRPDLAALWSDREVATRGLTLFPRQVCAARSICSGEAGPR